MQLTAAELLGVAKEPKTCGEMSAASLLSSKKCPLFASCSLANVEFSAPFLCRILV